MGQTLDADKPPDTYDAPESYRNLDNAAPPSLRGSEEDAPGSAPGIQWKQSRAVSEREARNFRRHSAHRSVDYDVPDAYTNLNEVADVSPIQNPDEEPVHRYESLEHVRALDQEGSRQAAAIPVPKERRERREQVSRLATQIYTVSYLILFSLLGTLARLSLQALTKYPGMPVIFPSVWPNFAGSLIMGFLAEDRMLFSNAKSHMLPSENTSPSRSGDEERTSPPDLEAAKKAHAALKKTVPLYIGLATGFCGSFTSFSSFIRDLFLAISNDLPPTAARNRGYSLASVLAVLITSVSLSVSALFIGAHLAIALEPLTPSLPYTFTRKIVDRIAVPLAIGVWLTAAILCILPPDRSLDPAQESWRGAATFALAFAPLGCLARFYASLRLNGRVASFPLGTFAVNIVGTVILAMAWDLAHVPLGDNLGCQVLQGIEDGFCGCLTTVSTWVAELATLRRRNAYIYGGSSVALGFGLTVAIMGGLRWGSEDGFVTLGCIHTF